VDSGGGSSFASELILRELERFQETDRPVVVSMGSVAASGGYWISMSADEI
jgi:protease-4